MRKNLFAGAPGVVLAGTVIGLGAVLLQFLGNPANMGICVACFERDIVGSLGLHRAAVVQYLRPEILGLVFGASLAALLSREFRPRGGSAPIVRFVLGFIAMLGALVFLGCPWRAMLRLAGGDGNAILGLVGLAAGIGIGTLFLRRGYSLGRNTSQARLAGWIFPALMGILLILALVFPPLADQPQNGVLFTSLKGPGSQRAPMFIALGLTIIAGFLAQRSRFCSMGAIRDLILFRQPHLFYGLLAFILAAFIGNLLAGQFHPGFENQPIAQPDAFWNFMSMLTAGLAFTLAGGCAGRQLFLAGEGDSDAAVFVLGMMLGAAFAHNMGMASSTAGIGPHGAIAVFGGLLVSLIIGFCYLPKKEA